MLTVKEEEQFFEEVLEKDDVSFIYFYTPMCGTCQLVRRFLEIVEKMENVPKIYESDINYFRRIAKEWKIESVPCFVAARGEMVLGKLYAFESVTNVYEFIQTYYSSESL